MRSAEEVHKFWFVEHSGKDWFASNPDFDRELDEKFRATHEAVANGEAWEWRTSARGRLCEILVLDQFSRQLHRGSGQAFATDAMALVLAQEMVALGLDEQTDQSERLFVYLPYMHSESLKVHDEAVRLFAKFGNEGNIEFEQKHVDLIKRFGRFPMRNAALGRESTPKEIAYIKERGGSMF